MRVLKDFGACCSALAKDIKLGVPRLENGYLKIGGNKEPFHFCPYCGTPITYEVDEEKTAIRESILREEQQ